MYKLINSIPYISIFGVVKRISYQKTYSQFVFLIPGLFYFFQKRGVDRIFYPLLGLVGIVSLQSLVFVDKEMAMRAFQILIMIGVSGYFARLEDLEVFKKLVITILGVAAIIFILQLMFMTPIFKFRIRSLGIVLPRYNHLVGEPNFSSLLLYGTFLISACLKDKKLIIASIIMVVLCLSRGSMLACILFGIYFFILKRIPVIWGKRFNLTLLMLILAYPFMIELSGRVLPENIQIDLSNISNRYYVQLSYMRMTWDNILGVGVGKGSALLSGYEEIFRESILSKLTKGIDDTGEQHSLYIQVINELGILGYVFLAIFFRNILKVAQETSSVLSTAWLLLLFNFLFLNALNEFILYLMVGFILCSARNSGKGNVLSEVWIK